VTVNFQKVLRYFITAHAQNAVL